MQIKINSCRICLSAKNTLSPIFSSKLSRNYAEMLTSIADVVVAYNDGLPNKICDKCCIALEKACLIKTVAERSDKELRNKLEKLEVPTLAIKVEIEPLIIKAEPICEMEQEVNAKDDKADLTWKDIKTNISNDGYTKSLIKEDDDDVPLNKIKNKSKRNVLKDNKKTPKKKEKKRYKLTCSQCPRTFKNISVLNQHSCTKEHYCKVCGVGFYTLKSLKRHELIHDETRLYPCKQCSKRFISGYDLSRHLRIHTGDKPFKCTTCHMSFTAKHHLNNHERLHSGERPYTCKVCNVAFSYKVKLNNHVLKVHGIDLKYKSIYTVTEDVLLKEYRINDSMSNNGLHLVPPATAHETALDSTE